MHTNVGIEYVPDPVQACLPDHVTQFKAIMTGVAPTLGRFCPISLRARGRVCENGA
jgi:hypothetical protein